MDMWKKFALGLAAGAGLTPTLWAQAVPAVPVAPVAPVAAPAAVPVAPAPAQPQTLWGFLGLSKSNLADCKVKFCASPIGQFFNNATLPLGALSGGLITSCCPPGPSAAALAMPPTSEQGAAARIMKEEAEAKARRAAVRYLGTVDCRYWPEAQAALVKALRFDPNECVRWEAAMALGHGCCCNKVTIAALTEAVSDAPKDKAPAELSERVKASASFALANCLAKVTIVTESAPVPEPPRERPPREVLPAPIPQASAGSCPDYYAQVETMTMEQLVDRAQHCLAEGRPSARVASTAPMNRQAGERSLLGIFASASKTPATPIQPARPSAESVAMAQTTIQPLVPAVETSAPQIAAAIPVQAPPTTQVVQAPPPPPPQPSTPAPQLTPVVHTVPASPLATLTAPVTSGPASAASEFPAPGSTSATLDQMLAVLTKAPSVKERTWAANNLAHVDWRDNPQMVQTMVRCARQDSATSVRVECVRSLARMGANTKPVLSALEALRTDGDAMVRLEANLALIRLNSSQNSPYQSAGAPRN